MTMYWQENMAVYILNIFLSACQSINLNMLQSSFASKLTLSSSLFLLVSIVDLIRIYSVCSHVLSYTTQLSFTRSTLTFHFILECLSAWLLKLFNRSVF